VVRSAIASPKRERSDSALLCRIRVSLSLSRALGECGALCVCVAGIYAEDSWLVSVVTCV
jgi:hypothetical protein